MNKEELLMLIKAGYTKDEITALYADTPGKEPEEVKPEEVEQPEEVKHEDVKKADVNEDIEKLKNQFNTMSEEIGKLVAGLQNMNIKNARQAEPNGHNNVDEILKNMLNPSK